jgi:hypothetical protein
VSPGGFFVIICTVPSRFDSRTGTPSVFVATDPFKGYVAKPKADEDKEK